MDRSISVHRFSPLLARTQAAHAVIEPIAFDFVKFVVVRAGGSLLFGELDTNHVMSVFSSCLRRTRGGAESEDWVTTKTQYLDRDHVIDQMFWQYAEQFAVASLLEPLVELRTLSFLLGYRFGLEPQERR